MIVPVLKSMSAFMVRLQCCNSSAHEFFARDAHVKDCSAKIQSIYPSVIFTPYSNLEVMRPSVYDTVSWISMGLALFLVLLVHLVPALLVGLTVNELMSWRLLLVFRVSSLRRFITHISKTS
jgi:hypothetical protein